MKKALILLSFLCFYICTEAQNTKEYDVYAFVRTSSVVNDNYFIILPNEKNGQRILDENGRDMTFNNTTHLFTYLSKRGWRYVDKFQDRGELSSGEYITMETVFVLSKKVTSDEDITEGLKLEVVQTKTKKRGN